MKQVLNFDGVLRLRLGRAEREALDRLASVRGLTTSALVREAIGSLFLAEAEAATKAVEHRRLVRELAVLARAEMDRRAALKNAEGRAP